VEDGSANRHARGWTIAVALVVLLVAFALRVNGLTAGGLHLDEGYSLIQSERSVIDIFALNRFDANPPFYILTLHLWRTLFGDGEWALKSLGMMAGVVGVAAIGLAARVRFGVTAGLAAAWFVALNAFHLQQSQEIRGYSLLLAAVALADFAFVRWFETGSRRALFGFALATFYAVNVHHFAWGFALVQMGSVLIRPRSEAQRRDIARVLLGVVVLSLPMLASFAIHLVVHQSQSWIPLRGLDGLLGVLGEIAGRDAFAVLAGLLALLGGVGAAFPKQRLAALGSFVSPELETDRVRAVAVPALQLTLPVVLFVGSYLLFPMLLARYCVITILPLGVLVGAGAAALRPRLLLLIACAALLVLARGPIVAEYANELRLADQQRWSEIVRDEYREGDVVLYTDKYVFVPAIALHPPEMHEYLMPRLEGRNVSTVLEHYTVRTVRREPLRPGEFERAWIVKRPNEPLDRVLRDPMLAGTRPRLIRRVRETEIYLFALPASR
jgi:hypothetical protein